MRRATSGKWFEELTPGLVLDHAITRTVRAGFRSRSRRPVCMATATPAASSMAPVPRSQESRWPLTITTSCGRTLPRMSAITL